MKISGLLFLAFITITSCVHRQENAMDQIEALNDTSLLKSKGYEEFVHSDLGKYVSCILKKKSYLLSSIDISKIDTTNSIIARAYQLNDFKTVEILLKYGCSTNIPFMEDDDNANLLNLMSMSDTLTTEEFKCIKLVVEHGVNINNRGDVSNWTPLLRVCNGYKKGGYELAEYLIEKGADVNYSFYSYNYHELIYPLEYAFGNKRYDLVELFLNYNAYPHNERDYKYMKDDLRNIKDTALSAKLTKLLEASYNSRFE